MNKHFKSTLRLYDSMTTSSHVSFIPEIKYHVMFEHQELNKDEALKLAKAISKLTKTKINTGGLTHDA